MNNKIQKLLEEFLLNRPGDLRKDDYKFLIFAIIPELKKEDKFEQKNPWHIYDVWEHTIVAIENSKKDEEIRLALLLHDVGKPYSFQRDGNILHFKGHSQKSAEMAEIILKRLEYSQEEIQRLCYLINNHSKTIDIDSLNEHNLELNKKLLEIQYADCRAYNPEYVPKVLEKLDIIKEKINLKEQALRNKNDEEEEERDI